MSHEQNLTLDKPLFFSVLALLAIGLIFVASSSVAISYHTHQDSFYFFIKQIIFAIIGLGFLLGFLWIPSQFWGKHKNAIFFAGLIMLLLVLLPGIGSSVNGSRRWLHLGPLHVQVSELVKLCGIIYVAGYFAKYKEEAREKIIGIIKPLALLGIFGILLLLEPDFGATVVLFATALGIMFMARVRFQWFIILIALALLAGVALIFISPYRMARFTGFMHPWQNALTSGYQLTQSLIGFGKGGILGAGIGNSIQKLFYLPEAHTDFILAIIAEETGLLGVTIVLSLFATLVWRGLSIARKAHQLQRAFAAYLAYGITFWLGLQVIVNFCVNIGLLPTKGLTLPLISYGGSSLVIDLAVIGILLRIDTENKLP